MYSEVSAGPLPHSCLDKCVQDVAALSIIPKFPMYSKSHRALQSNLTVALARTCNDYSLLFRKTKISQSVFGILLTALLEEPQQRGYHYGILAEFLGRNCFLQPFANDLLLWLSLVKNKEFLEELFRVALCNPYPYFMKDAFWTR